METPTPDRQKICGQFFGHELLLSEMRAGTGIRPCCLLFKDHEGEHAMDNPDLMKDLEYEPGDLG